MQKCIEILTSFSQNMNPGRHQTISIAKNMQVKPQAQQKRTFPSILDIEGNECQNSVSYQYVPLYCHTVPKKCSKNTKFLEDVVWFQGFIQKQVELKSDNKSLIQRLKGRIPKERQLHGLKQRFHHTSTLILSVLCKSDKCPFLICHFYGSCLHVRHKKPLFAVSSNLGTVFYWSIQLVCSFMSQGEGGLSPRSSAKE